MFFFFLGFFPRRGRKRGCGILLLWFLFLLFFYLFFSSLNKPTSTSLFFFTTKNKKHKTQNRYDYSMAVAPNGREGLFTALASAPLFLAKLPTGALSGALLQKFCAGIPE